VWTYSRSRTISGRGIAIRWDRTTNRGVRSATVTAMFSARSTMARAAGTTSKSSNVALRTRTWVFIQVRAVTAVLWRWPDMARVPLLGFGAGGGGLVWCELAADTSV
jgi:hypothetical protein